MTIGRHGIEPGRGRGGRGVGDRERDGTNVMGVDDWTGLPRASMVFDGDL